MSCVAFIFIFKKIRVINFCFFLIKKNGVSFSEVTMAAWREKEGGRGF
jgi:hypothetical protein